MTRLKNRYITRICERFGEHNHYRAIQRLVGEYRRNGETLERVADKLGVTGIVKERLPFDGGVFWDGQGLKIKLNSVSPWTRQRFTFAHELAHLILDPKKATSARRCVVSSCLEGACDAVASEPGVDAASFTITRTGVTNAPMLVQYTIGGSAVNGDDYNVISNFVEIPAL